MAACPFTKTTEVQNFVTQSRTEMAADPVWRSCARGRIAVERIGTQGTGGPDWSGTCRLLRFRDSDIFPAMSAAEAKRAPGLRLSESFA
jgi:hypothetical protein